MKSYLKIFIFLLISISFISCKTKAEKTKELEQIKKICNKYEDEYTDYKYLNKKLGLTMEFNSDWVINTDYENFDDFQKKYAIYFSSDISEVLFVGYNNEKKIGIRCTCEELGLTNEKYFELIKISTKEEIQKYKIVFTEENEEAIFKNIKGLLAVFETTINSNNIFVFNTFIFSKDGFNYKIDIWIEKDLYEIEKSYINTVLDTIDFISIENIPSPDTTDDIEIKKTEDIEK